MRGFGQEPATTDPEELRPYLLTPGEWASAGMVIAGSAMMIGADWFGWHSRWNRVGGTVLTISGAVSAWIMLRRHTTAKQALGA